MPVYEYRCNACGDQFELRQKFSDAPVTECPKCGGEVAKLISSTRAKRVQHHYSVIGGGSPIRKFTEEQAAALESIERMGDE